MNCNDLCRICSHLIPRQRLQQKTKQGQRERKQKTLFRELKLTLKDASQKIQLNTMGAIIIKSPESKRY